MAARCGDARLRPRRVSIDLCCLESTQPNALDTIPEYAKHDSIRIFIKTENNGHDKSVASV
jgi:hypothetical protein